jgi:UDP-N-acetylglucosamine 2-epimerase (non-hydrolysing)
MERPEAQDTGTIILTGFEPGVVLDSIALAVSQLEQSTYHEIPPDYTITNTSWRVLKLIQGNAGLSNLWHGIAVF